MVFQPGQSGNPNGRPKMSPEVKAALEKNTMKAINILIKLMGSKDEDIKLKAANSILDRSLGKPTQTIGGDPENPLQSSIVILPAKNGRVVIPDERNSSLAT